MLTFSNVFFTRVSYFLFHFAHPLLISSYVCLTHVSYFLFHFAHPHLISSYVCLTRVCYFLFHFAHPHLISSYVCLTRVCYFLFHFAHPHLMSSYIYLTRVSYFPFHFAHPPLSTLASPISAFKSALSTPLCVGYFYYSNYLVPWHDQVNGKTWGFDFLTLNNGETHFFTNINWDIVSLQP